MIPERKQAAEAALAQALQDAPALTPLAVHEALLRHGFSVYKEVTCPVPDGDTNKLWDDCFALCAQLSGEQVAEATLEATEVIWDSGADHTYAEVVKQEGITEANADRFHGIWLQAFKEALQDLVSGVRRARDDEPVRPAA